MILMPLSVAFVGVFGSLVVSCQQGCNADKARLTTERAAERLAIEDRRLKAVDIFLEKITSPKDEDRKLALDIVSVVDSVLAKDLWEIGVTQLPASEDSVPSPQTGPPKALRELFLRSENFYEPAVGDPGYRIDSMTGSLSNTLTIPSNSAVAGEWGGREFELGGEYTRFTVRVLDPGTKSLRADGVEYRVTGDGQTLAYGYPRVSGVDLDLDVSGVKVLRLESSTGSFDGASAAMGRNQNYADFVWWMHPEVIPAP